MTDIVWRVTRPSLGARQGYIVTGRSAVALSFKEPAFRRLRDDQIKAGDRCDASQGGEWQRDEPKPVGEWQVRYGDNEQRHAERQQGEKATWAAQPKRVIGTNYEHYGQLRQQ